MYVLGDTMHCVQLDTVLLQCMGAYAVRGILRIIRSAEAHCASCRPLVHRVDRILSQGPTCPLRALVCGCTLSKQWFRIAEPPTLHLQAPCADMA